MVMDMERVKDPQPVLLLWLINQGTVDVLFVVIRHMITGHVTRGVKVPRNPRRRAT